MESKSHSSHFDEIFNVNKETNGESETHIRCSVSAKVFENIKGGNSHFENFPGLGQYKNQVQQEKK